MARAILLPITEGGGTNLKTVEALTGVTGPTATIPPTLAAFDEAITPYESESTP